MIEQTASMVYKLATEVARLRQKEREDIDNAVATHTSLPEHYWQKRWVAEEKLRAARALFAVLIEDRHV